MQLSLALAVIAAALVAVVLVVPLGDLGPPGQSSFSTQTSTSGSTTTFASPSPYCLVSIPSDAEMGPYVNSTFNGNIVTWPNGTRSYFSSYSCTQPVYGERNDGPIAINVYDLAAATESNYTFIGLEKGLDFIFQSSSGLLCYPGIQQCLVFLYFYHYAANITSVRCGGSTLYQREAPAGMIVRFRSTGSYVNGSG